MKKRFFSILLCMCMVMGLLPSMAWAEDGLTITGGTLGTDYTYDGNLLTIIENGTYMISGNGTMNTSDMIYIQARDGKVNITLDGVNLDGSANLGLPVFSFDADKHATVNLTLKGDNVLKAFEGYAGLEVPQGSTLNITGDSTGTLNAIGGSGGAGMGGDLSCECGTINILGGNVKAVAGTDAQAIGRGSTPTDNSGTLKGVNGDDLLRTPTVVTLEGITDAGVTVSDLSIKKSDDSTYAYGTTIRTLGNGELYLWLPSGETVTGAVVGDKQFSGSVTSGQTGTLPKVLGVASVTPSDGGTPTEYTDFNDALTAAQNNDGSTLMLLKDYSGSVTISGGEFTLDLNGYTITGTKGEKVNEAEIQSQPGLILENSANVTLRATGGGQIIGGAGKDEKDAEGEDGQPVSVIESPMYGSTAVYVKSGCAFTVYGGTLKSGECGGWYLAQVESNPYYSEVLVTEAGGTAVLYGGSYVLDISNIGGAYGLFRGEGSLPSFYHFYDSSNQMLTETVLNNLPPETETVTVGERDWSSAISYDGGTKTYTVFSADGLDWVSAVANGTITADTFQNDPTMPEKGSEGGYFDGATVKLNNDIDLSVENWTPIKWFGGTFDGAGHRITGMKVDGTYDQGGFFASLAGEVRNLYIGGIVNVNSSNNIDAGGIVGFVSEYGSIYNCVSDVSVTATSTAGQAAYAGGLAGSNDGNIGNCFLKEGNSSALLGRVGDYSVTENCYTPVGTAIVGIVGNSSTITSVGTYDISGNLIATNGTTLGYGTTLSNAMKYWVNRQDEGSIESFVAWTTDAIPSLTFNYAQQGDHTFTPWTPNTDGGYTRTDLHTGVTQTAEAVVTLSGGTAAPYATLEEAITAAKAISGSTVKLITNVTTEETIEIASGTFTIDLNGKTWESTVEDTDALLLKGTAKVTLKDSASGGTFTSTACNGNSTVRISAASATIEGGSYRATGDAGCGLKILDIVSEGKKVTITGGSFEGESWIYDSKDVELSGGSFASLKVNVSKDDVINKLDGFLADGYAYRSTLEGNAWVEDAHVDSLSNVSVQAAPVRITKQPTDETAIYGATTGPTLSVTAEKINTDGDISYQWFLGGTALAGEKSATLSFPTGYSAGSYTYYCAVTCDGCTVNSKPVTVSVDKAAGHIANKETNGYPTIQTYQNLAIAAENNFFDTNAESNLVYTWYEGQNPDGSVANLTKLTPNQAPTNAGEYTLMVAFEESDNVNAASTTLKVKIYRATPELGEVSYLGDTLYTSTAPSAVALIGDNTSLDGTLALDGVTALTTGTNSYPWKFTPTDTQNYNTVTGTISLTVTADTLDGISIGSTTPSKKAYHYGDTFDTTGLIVKATYLSGAEKDVTALVTVNELAVGNTSATLNYTDGGVTKNCTVDGISVAQASALNIGEQSKNHIRTVATTGNTVLLAALLPENRGVTAYQVTSSSYSGLENVSVSTDGILSYDTKVSSSILTDTITVKVTMKNYEATTITVKVNLTDKNDVTFSGLSAPSNRVYNGMAVASAEFGIPTYSPLWNGTLIYTYYKGNNVSGSPLSEAPKDAGTYTVRISIPDDDTAYVGYTDITFTIGKATVIATADNKDMKKDSTFPQFTVSYTGIASGDTAESIFATPATATTTADGKTTGSYPITVTVPVLKTDMEKNYIVGDSVNGMLTVSNSSSGGSSSGGSSSGGSSSGGSSSGGSTGVAPTNKTNGAQISSGTHNVSASASVSGNTATVSATDAQIKEIVLDKGTGNPVKIDVSGLKVDTVVVPAKVVAAMNSTSGSEALEAVLASGTVTLDKTAVLAIANKGDVKLSVETVANSALSNEQKAVLGTQASSATVVDVNVYVNGTKTSTFGGGKIEVSVPYTLKVGENADSITVWFIKDDGTIEPKNGVYRDGKVEFTTNHLSQYLIVSFPFADVEENSWYYGSVAYAYTNGLFSGTSKTTFGPNTAMTREMIWMVLARMDGKAPANMAGASAWAKENKISDGSNPKDIITREQLAAILYRYSEYKGYNVTVGDKVLSYSDAAEVSKYAISAVQWACNCELLKGDANKLLPSGNATRTQVAAILMRFYQNVEK